MKSSFFTFLLLISLSSIGAQSFCLQFVEISNNGSKYIVEIQIQGSSDFKLGSSNLQFRYNSAALSNPVLRTSPLAPPTYQVPTVTTPTSGETSFNIELAFANFGSTFSASDWINLGQIEFDVLDNNLATGFAWSYNGGTTNTVIFLDDETTQIFATSIDCLTALDNLLPLDLLSFFAFPLNDFIQLRWQTENEENVKGFEIERSLNGNDFGIIGFEHSNALNSSDNTYAFKDRDIVPDQTYYYRLRMIDLDGSYDYSPIRSAQLRGEEKIIIFPNPSDGKVGVLLGECQENNSAALIFLVNSAQQRLKTYSQEDWNNANILEIDLSNYSKGLYFLQIKCGSDIFHKPIVYY